MSAPENIEHRTSKAAPQRVKEKGKRKKFLEHDTNMKTTESKSESDHVFSCDFGDGVTATMTVDITAGRAGREPREWLKFKVEGTVRRKHVPLFRPWGLDVHQKVTDLLGRTMFWPFNPDEKIMELYRFAPEQPYHQVVLEAE